MPSLLKLKRRFQGQELLNESHKGSDLRSMAAFQARLLGSQFSECKFGLADLRNTVINGCLFSECSMQMVNFSVATVRGCRFVKCDLEQAFFTGAILEDCSFDECRMAYSTFAGATLRENVRFHGCNLHGADLDFIEAAHPNFLGSNLWGVKQPLGCAFWNGKFDSDHVKYFAAMLARMSDDRFTKSRLIDIAGDKFMVVERLMGGQDE